MVDRYNQIKDSELAELLDVGNTYKVGKATTKSYGTNGQRRTVIEYLENLDTGEFTILHTYEEIEGL